jgi:hypothetical protein
MNRGLVVASVSLVALVGLTTIMLAQRGRFREREEDDAPMPVRNAEYHFIRVEYTDRPEFHRRWGYSSRDGMARAGGWWTGRRPKIISRPELRG